MQAQRPHGVLIEAGRNPERRLEDQTEGLGPQLRRGAGESSHDGRNRAHAGSADHRHGQMVSGLGVETAEDEIEEEAIHRLSA